MPDPQPDPKDAPPELDRLYPKLSPEQKQAWAEEALEAVRIDQEQRRKQEKQPPDRIPEDILQAQVDHRRPYSGDRGVLFEAASDLDAEDRKALRDILAPFKTSGDAGRQPAAAVSAP